MAEEWAKNLAKKDVMQHRQNNEYGENLYCAYSSDPKFKVKGDVAVKSWYEEIKDFTFGREPSDLRSGKWLPGAIVFFLDSLVVNRDR